MTGKMHQLSCLGVLVLLAVGVSAESVHLVTQDYTYWCQGECSTDVQTTTQQAVILMGGGTDVDDAFKRQIELSGGGDFLVLRTYGDNAYNPYIVSLGHVHSAATLLLNNRNASFDPFVLKKVQAAEAVFFAGGDQSTYVNYWTGTPLQKELVALAAVAPMGGTSAGCAILGGFIYTAENDTVESVDALANPYDYRVTLGGHFLPYKFFSSLITDPHFVTRDRMGRLTVFVARLMQDGNTTLAYGIGIDEKTAIIVDANGKGTAVGSSSAYVLTPSAPPDTCQPGVPLTFTSLSVREIQSNEDTYDFVAMTGTGDSWSLSVDDGVLSPSDPYDPPSLARRGGL